MSAVILTPEQGEEYKELLKEHGLASLRAFQMLRIHGMESRHFLEAEENSCRIWKRLRELQGMAGRHWME